MSQYEGQYSLNQMTWRTLVPLQYGDKSESVGSKWEDIKRTWEICLLMKETNVAEADTDMLCRVFCFTVETGTVSPA